MYLGSPKKKKRARKKKGNIRKRGREMEKFKEM